MPIKSVSIFFIDSPISTISVLTLSLDTEYLECLNHLNHPQGSCAHKHTRSCAHLHTDTCAHRHTCADTHTHTDTSPVLLPEQFPLPLFFLGEEPSCPLTLFLPHHPPTHSLGLSGAPPTLIPGRFPIPFRSFPLYDPVLESISNSSSEPQGRVPGKLDKASMLLSLQASQQTAPGTQKPNLPSSQP